MVPCMLPAIPMLACCESNTFACSERDCYGRITRAPTPCPEFLLPAPVPRARFALCCNQELCHHFGRLSAGCAGQCGRDFASRWLELDSEWWRPAAPRVSGATVGLSHAALVGAGLAAGRRRWGSVLSIMTDQSPTLDINIPTALQSKYMTSRSCIK